MKAISMKACCSVLMTTTLVAAWMFLFAGCVNRFQEYEPYSTFDERMAAEQSRRPVPTDDQMPPGMDDPYGQYSYSGGGYNGSATWGNGSSGDSMWGPPPPDDSQPRLAERKQQKNIAGGSGGMGGGSGGSSSELEVPFNDSRGPKHSANIGAL